MILLLFLTVATGLTSFVGASITTDPVAATALFCSLGSCGGSIVGMLLWPAKTVRGNAALVLLNLLFGIFFGPLLCIALKARWPMADHPVFLPIACGAATGAFLAALVKAVAPFLPKVLDRLLNRIK